MSSKMKLTCVSCRRVQSSSYSPVCDSCGALTNPVYELNKVRLRRCDNSFRRFWDLLPIQDTTLLPDDIGYTPVVWAKSLGQKMGLPYLYLKNETVLPTRTTKYRMAAVSLPYMYESGVSSFSTSSTGNSSTAYAKLLPRIPEMRMSLFTASDFEHRVNYRHHSRINHFILEGASFAEAFEVAGRYAKAAGFTSERGFFNPGRREGLKLAYFEAVDQVPRTINWYVQAVSSAMGVYGTYSGARELKSIDYISRVPKLLCVQQSSCAPMAHAWSDGAETISEHHLVRTPTGIAEAILRGDPTRVYPYVRRVVKESGGEIAAVSEQEIRQARRSLLEEEGIDACFSASTAVAGLARLAGSGVVSPEETILINLTGGERHEPAAPGLRFQKVDGQWRSEETGTDVLPQKG